MNIVLTGFMGTGKTAVGKKLAEKMNRRYIDVDELIEKEAGIKISEIFSKLGEPYFRGIEAKMIKRAMEYDNCVIATGGGAVLKDENMSVLEKNGYVVNLTASPQVIYERTKSSKDRPLLNRPDPMKEIVTLLEYRKRFYERCNISINTDNLTIEEITESIVGNFNARKP